jgi:hypothetical protein
LGEGLEARFGSGSGLGCLSCGKLDAVAGHFSFRVLLGDKVEVLLSNLQASMGSYNIGVFNVLVVQDAQAPIRVLVPLCILELGDLAEDSNLLDQTLQSTDMDREGRIVSVAFNSFLLILAELLDPDSNNLLKLRACQKAERSILAGAFIVAVLDLLLQAITESIAEIREFLLVGKGTQGSHNFLPVGQVGIMHHIPQVLTHNRCEQAHIVRTRRLLGEVVLLCLFDAFGAAANSNHKSIRHLILPEGNIQSFLELPKEQSPSNLFLCLAF